jgi:5,10-methylenetetrahydromethanopterin reductase
VSKRFGQERKRTITPGLHRCPDLRARAANCGALAAARTSRIRLGVSAITPRLRHVVATATALATLHAHAPGRVEAVVGSGFTAQIMLGQKPAPWAEVEQYVVALRDLLGGREIEWDGALTGLKHGPRTAITPPGPDIPLYIAAHGPRGYGPRSGRATAS